MKDDLHPHVILGDEVPNERGWWLDLMSLNLNRPFDATFRVIIREAPDQALIVLDARIPIDEEDNPLSKPVEDVMLKTFRRLYPYLSLDQLCSSENE